MKTIIALFVLLAVALPAPAQTRAVTNSIASLTGIIGLSNSVAGASASNRFAILGVGGTTHFAPEVTFKPRATNTGNYTQVYLGSVNNYTFDTNNPMVFVVPMAPANSTNLVYGKTNFALDGFNFVMLWYDTNSAANPITNLYSVGGYKLGL